MSELPTEHILRRPVYDRYLRRKHLMPLEPPTRDEIADARLALDDEWDDDVRDEAVRILAEVQAIMGA